MRTTTARDRSQDRIGVDAHEVRIGKDLIEILTTGMYVSPLAIYREYIQNAADSIDGARASGLLPPGDRGHVWITFDHAARSVTVRDDGAGIPRREALSVLLAMGGSPKRGTPARGFRGVGRLSGLAYCRELEFRTKAPGESTVVTVTWNCCALRERLGDAAFGGDLQRIVSDVVSVWYEDSGDPADHFFEVRLIDVGRHRNDLLLNERLITHYLSQVGPLPFAPDFSFAAAIEQRLSEYSLSAPLELTVAGKAVYRPHRDECVFPGTAHKLLIEEIEFVEFADVDGGTGALAWIAHHEYIRSLPAALGLRGWRARFGDLQVGESDLFEDSFKEPRFNGWTIGEIHVFDRRIVPNARRDQFELNHHYYNLLVQLGPVAAQISHRCRTSSVSRNAAKIVRNVVAEVDARLAEERALDLAEASRLRAALVRAQVKLKGVVDESLQTELASELGRVAASLAKRRPVAGASMVALDEALALVAKTVTNREQARKLAELFRQLCG